MVPQLGLPTGAVEIYKIAQLRRPPIELDDINQDADGEEDDDEIGSNKATPAFSNAD